MMKEILVALSLTGAMAPVCSEPQQAPIPVELLALQRGDWGCQVLLCLANPQGPTAEEKCRPPIERLWRELRRGHAFPTCAMATGPNGRSFATPNYGAYDPCPGGTTELTEGQRAEVAGAIIAAPPPSRSGAASTYSPGSTGYLYTGIGGGDNYGWSNADSGPPPVKICVAGLQGYRTLSQDETSYNVGLYDTVYVSPRQNPRAIDVFVDNALWQRVRW